MSHAQMAVRLTDHENAHNRACRVTGLELQEPLDVALQTRPRQEHKRCFGCIFVRIHVDRVVLEKRKLAQEVERNSKCGLRYRYFLFNQTTYVFIVRPSNGTLPQVMS